MVCDLYREHAYDLILLDLQMPDMSGFHTTWRNYHHTRASCRYRTVCSAFWAEVVTTRYAGNGLGPIGGNGNEPDFNCDRADTTTTTATDRGNCNRVGSRRGSSPK